MGLRRILLPLLLCAALLMGCGSEKTLSGEVSQMRERSFVLTTEEGDSYTVSFTGETPVFSWMEQLSPQDFLEGEREGIFVTVQYQKSRGKYHAQQILIDGLLTRNAMELSDGTPVNVMDRGTPGDILYYLEDGTELLWERKPIGPAHVHAGASVSFDDLNETAQKNIQAFLNAKGPYYDIPELLEEAYAAYTILGGKFQPRGVSLDISPTASNDHIICFLTDVVLPGWMDYGTSIREGAVFDLETGAFISGYELFTCDPGELEEVLIEQMNLEEGIDKTKISLGLQPESFVLFADGSMEIYLKECNIPNYSENLIMGMAPEQIRDILQPWAVMEPDA